MVCRLADLFYRSEKLFGTSFSLLFLIYINDISNTSNDGEFILFADNTNIFVRGQTALLQHLKLQMKF